MEKRDTSAVLRRARFGLLGMIVLFVLLHLFTVYFAVYHKTTFLDRSSRWFDLDNEFNIPTLYSCLLLLSCGALALRLAWHQTKKLSLAVWFGAGMTFIYLAFDEWFILHELLALPIRNRLAISNTSLLFHAWIIIPMALIVLGLLLLVIFRKRLSLPAHRNLLGIIILFMFGVVVFEVVGTPLFGRTALYRLGLVTLEESFELTMSSLILYQLLKINLNLKLNLKPINS